MYSIKDGDVLSGLKCHRVIRAQCMIYRTKCEADRMMILIQDLKKSIVSVRLFLVVRYPM